MGLNPHFEQCYKSARLVFWGIQKAVILVLVIGLIILRSFPLPPIYFWVGVQSNNDIVAMLTHLLAVVIRLQERGGRVSWVHVHVSTGWTYGDVPMRMMRLTFSRKSRWPTWKRSKAPAT